MQRLTEFKIRLLMSSLMHLMWLRIDKIIPSIRFSVELINTLIKSKRASPSIQSSSEFNSCLSKPIKMSACEMKLIENSRIQSYTYPERIGRLQKIYADSLRLILLSVLSEYSTQRLCKIKFIWTFFFILSFELESNFLSMNL